MNPTSMNFANIIINYLKDKNIPHNYSRVNFTQKHVVIYLCKCNIHIHDKHVYIHFPSNKRIKYSKHDPLLLPDILRYNNVH